MNGEELEKKKKEIKGNNLKERKRESVCNTIGTREFIVVTFE